VWLALGGSAIERQGCYNDDTSKRDLPNDVSTQTGGVVPSTCMTACTANRYLYGATQVGTRFPLRYSYEVTQVGTRFTLYL